MGILVSGDKPAGKRVVKAEEKEGGHKGEGLKGPKISSSDSSSFKQGSPTRPTHPTPKGSTALFAKDKTLKGLNVTVVGTLAEAERAITGQTDLLIFGVLDEYYNPSVAKREILAIARLPGYSHIPKVVFLMNRPDANDLVVSLYSKAAGKESLCIPDIGSAKYLQPKIMPDSPKAGVLLFHITAAPGGSFSLGEELGHPAILGIKDNFVLMYF